MRTVLGDEAEMVPRTDIVTDRAARSVVSAGRTTDSAAVAQSDVTKKMKAAWMA